MLEHRRDHFAPVRNRLTVRLVVRSGVDRLDPARPHAYMVEAGYEAPTAKFEKLTKVEKGRMVSVLFSSRDELPAALHALADLWARFTRRSADGMTAGPEPVYFDLPGQPRFTMPLPPTQLADKIHLLADGLLERRVVVPMFGPRQ